MANFKLYEYGIENILEDIEEILQSVIGKDKSKRAKDVAMCKVMGMAKALNMAIIPEEETVIEEVTE